MKPIQIAQGDDFIFNISETDPLGSPVNLDQYPDLVAYLYTQDNAIIKFSKTVRTGYQLIEKVTSFQYLFQLLAEDSKNLFPGILTLEFLILDPTERTIFKAEIGSVVATKIKREIV